MKRDQRVLKDVEEAGLTPRRSFPQRRYLPRRAGNSLIRTLALPLSHKLELNRESPADNKVRRLSRPTYRRHFHFSYLVFSIAPLMRWKPWLSSSATIASAATFGV